MTKDGAQTRAVTKDGAQTRAVTKDGAQSSCDYGWGSDKL